jgi:spermidine/putrescine transport system substrate-binding protein
MSDRHDGSRPEVERALERYLAEQRITRRELIERIGALGAIVALAPIVAACAGSSASAAPSAASSSAAATSAVPSYAAAAPTGTPGPTPVPSPESELIVYNWLDYIGEDVIPSFEEKYPVKVKYELFDDIEVAYAKLGQDGSGYDLSFPISVDVPRFIKAGTLVKLDKSLLPNIVNLGAEWTDPGYDPGNTYSVPYVWWTTGVGYDTTKVTDSPTSSKALWDPRYKGHISMLDDYQEVFALALIQLGYSANTTDPAQLDEAFALLKQQKPLLRTYSTDTVGTMAGGDVWIGQIWGSDLYQIGLARDDENIAFYIPEEGGVRGSDTAAIYSGAKHPVAAHLFINHLLDAEVSASNTNFIGYMGPNEAARPFIDAAILADPAVNPDKAILAKLEELLDLPNAVDEEYLSRWQALKAGG